MSLLSAVAFIVTLAPVGQEGMPQPAPEMNQMNFLVGTWKGVEHFNMNGQKMDVNGTIRIKKAMQGMWMEESHISKLGKQVFMEGEQLTTFDPKSKKWKGWWFDNSAPYAMEMTGTMTGNTLTMISKPTEMPGMPGKVVVRSSVTKRTDREVDFKLEMQAQGKWSTMITAKYKKV